MFNDLTKITAIDKSNPMTDYDAFAVADKEGNVVNLFFSIMKENDKTIYLGLFVDGEYTIWDITDDELLSTYFNDEHTLYEVDKGSITINNVSYKRKI